jgi:hypothetical protein
MRCPRKRAGGAPPADSGRPGRCGTGLPIILDGTDAFRTAYCDTWRLRIRSGLADDASPVAAACAPMKKSLERLYRRAQREAGVRSDLTAVELLALISALPKPSSRDRRNRYLEVVLRGLRP